MPRVTGGDAARDLIGKVGQAHFQLGQILELQQLRPSGALQGQVPVFENGSWQPGERTEYGIWTPTLITDGAGADPVLGTGGFTSGTYVKVGKLVYAAFLVQFGTAGTNAGSGTYVMTGLPYATSHTAIGSARCWDASPGGGFHVDPVTHVPASTFAFERRGTSTTADTFVGNTHPFAWTINDFIAGNYIYIATE